MFNLGELINAAEEGANGVQDLPAAFQRTGTNYLYSSYCFAAGAIAATDYDTFVNAVGDSGQGFAVPLTNYLTNLDSGGGRVPDGESWVITHGGVVIDPGAGYDDAITLSRVLTLYFHKKSMRRYLGPTPFWPGGSGLTGMGVSTTVAATTLVPAVTNGVPAAGALTRFVKPLILASGEQFKFGFQCSNHLGAVNINADVILQVKLYGLFYEAIPT